jgi:hypothetical protein
MRLIDADSLESETCSGCVNNEHKYANCIDCALANAPTIDAIPMWWITEKFLDVLNKDKELSKAVWLVRKAWQQEQEAQDEKAK